MDSGLRRDHNSLVPKMEAANPKRAAEPLTLAAQFSQQSRPLDLFHDVSRETFSKLFVLL